MSATPAPNNSVAVHPRGRLNMATAPALREELTELLDSGQTRLVVDLSDVETVDSAAIGALLAMLKLARKAGGDLRIVSPSRQVAEVLKMTKLDRVLPAYPSVDTAFNPL
ncbi:MAG TPA: STAS domain-containing protein [Mycobacterium sp.]|nr:STAS domain-containing protein [Mycobacterium sp.]HRD10329.1 STAS domain-containing protein [Mycobacterium sp.]